MEEAFEAKLWQSVFDAIELIDESWASPENLKKQGGKGFDNAEYSIAITLAMDGRQVMSRDDSDGYGDAYVDGVRSEFKAPTSSTAIQTRLRKANKQQVDAVYLDVRGSGLDFEDAQAAVADRIRQFNDHGGPTFSEVWLISGQGTLDRVYKKGD